MKRLLLVLLPLAFVALGATAYLAGGSDAPAAPDAANTADAAETSGALPETSVYQIDATWTDRHDRPVEWASLRGRPRLTAMIFTSCGYACPRTVDELKQVLAQVPAARREALGLVLLSIDPERDTAEALQRFSTHHRLDDAQWTLLRGAETDVRTLAAVFGIRYKQEADGQFAHTNLITLLDTEGRVVYRHEGLGADPAPLLAAIEALPL